MKQSIKKIKSSIAAFFIAALTLTQASAFYQNVHTFRSIVPTTAWAAEVSHSNVSYTGTDFVLSNTTAGSIEYILAYQTSSQTEVIQGSDQNENGFSKTIPAGTCSSGSCVYHNPLRGIFKTQSNGTVSSIYFEITNNTLKELSRQTSSKLELTSSEQAWLQNPTANPLVYQNPQLADSCGVDMVLVLDSSGSISNSELKQMRTAFTSFAEAFLPRTATQIAVIDFDDKARLVQNFTNDKDTVIRAINTGTSGGWTNWQSALQEVDKLNFPRASKPDLVIFASDGHPTRPKSESQVQENMRLAIVEANKLKQDNVRIMTLGIGTDLAPENLQKISGPNQDTGDINADVITTDFDTLAKDLSDFANQLCAGKLMVKKQLDVNGDGDVTDLIDSDGSFEDSRLANWQMSVTGNATREQSTDMAGTTEFTLDPGTYSLTEVVGADSNFIFQQASCFRDNEPIGTKVDNGVAGITLDRESIVSCTVVNQSRTIPASENLLTLEKSNNQPNPVYADTEVEYTVTITAPFQTVTDVVITDTLPDGFTYVPGSWTAISSVRGDLQALGAMTEAVYASPGDWNIGTMSAGETITLTLRAHIDATQTPGIYVDRSQAQGMTRSQIVRANEDPFYVETQVEVIAAAQAGQTGGSGSGTTSGSQSTNQGNTGSTNSSNSSNNSNSTSENKSSAQETVEKVAGAVLGAWTELPKTGIATSLLSLFIAMMSIGGVIIFASTQIETAISSPASKKPRASKAKKTQK